MERGSESRQAAEGYSSRAVETMRAAPSPPQADALVSADSAVAAADAKSLAAWAIAAQRDFNAARFAVTSIGGGPSHSSLAAVELARGMAQTGRRVVIADLSRSGSELEKLCGVASGPGIADLVNGEAAFTKIIGRDRKSAVHLLRFGRDRSARAMAQLDERTGNILAALSNSYDVVVVHAGEAAPETAALLNQCEAVVVLAPANRHTEAADAVKELSSAGLRAVCHVPIGRPRKREAELSLAEGHA